MGVVNPPKSMVHRGVVFDKGIEFLFGAAFDGIQQIQRREEVHFMQWSQHCVHVAEKQGVTDVEEEGLDRHRPQCTRMRGSAGLTYNHRSPAACELPMQLSTFALQAAAGLIGMSEILWAAVFGFASLNILGLLARRFEPGRNRMTVGEMLAITVAIISIVMLGWELLFLFHLLPIRLNPR